MLFGRRKTKSALHRHGSTKYLAVAAIAIIAGCSAPENQTSSADQGISEASPSKTFESSDANLVESLLYQWWGLFEGPDRSAVLPFFENIFADDVILRMEEVKLDGRDAIRTTFASLPQNPHAHHLKEVSVTPLSGGRYQLDAAFIYQILQPDGAVITGNSAYSFEAAKQADGTFRLVKMTSNLGEQIADAAFEPSYARNRARGTIVQYLGVTDLLKSDYARLDDVLADHATIHGMIAPDDNAYSDRGDGVLAGRAEIARWLADRQDRMQWVGHQLTSIELTSLGDNRYEAATIIDVEAQPIEGDRISVTLPIKLTLEDNGGRFMHVTRIDR